MFKREGPNKYYPKSIELGSLYPIDSWDGIQVDVYGACPWLFAYHLVAYGA